jgi:hypothetical protein
MGNLNLINFQLENGVYIVPKILDSGYLAIGKRSCRSRGKSQRSKGDL